MSWTDEKIATLRDLWEQGLSASQIAAKFGDVTRNAVIGKVHRLGLSGRPTPQRAERTVRQPRPAAAAPATRAETPRGTPAVAAAPAYVPPAPRPAEVEAELEPMVKTSLLAINDRMCKWPLGDPTDQEFHFCGRRAQMGMPYCQEHARIAYQAAAPKREKRDRERMLRNLY